MVYCPGIRTPYGNMFTREEELMIELMYKRSVTNRVMVEASLKFQVAVVGVLLLLVIGAWYMWVEYMKRGR